MAHPTLYQPKPYFYPIGNTSPVCLTENLAPEEDAQILLLGCGDPRNILFTIYSELPDSQWPTPSRYTAVDLF
jgi:hypothetical protein